MKKFLLAILVAIFGLTISGQEVRFPAAIVSAGGSSYGSTLAQARWRLAPVHVITLDIDDKLKSDLKTQALPVKDWNVSIYPNPVGDHLYLEFELPESREFLLRITDPAGRVVFIQDAQPFINGSILEINMVGHFPSLYLLQVLTPDFKEQKIYCIQKL